MGKIILSTLLVLNLILAPFLSVNAETEYIWENGGVMVVHDNCTYTPYYAEEDTDVSRGDALLSAVSDSVDLDVLYLSEGTFDVGETSIDMGKNNSISTSIHGVSSTTTIIESSAFSEIIRATNNSQTTDLKIVATGDTSYKQYPWGIGDSRPGISNAYLKDVIIEGTWDGIFFNGFNDNSGNINVINVDVSSNWDAIFVANVGMNIFNSRFTVNYQPIGTNADEVAHALRAIIGSSINLFNTTLSSNGGVGENIGILTTRMLGQDSTVNMYGGSITTTNSENSFDLYNDSLSIINIDENVVYDSASTTGTINIIETIVEETPSLPGHSCDPYLFSSAPEIELQSPTNITVDSATLTATLSSYDEPSHVRGFYYGTDINYGATTTEEGEFEGGDFSLTLNSLTCGTDYYYSAYASNVMGTTTTAGTFSTLSCNTGQSEGRSSSRSSSSSTSVSTRICNLLSNGNIQLARELRQRYKDAEVNCAGYMHLLQDEQVINNSIDNSIDGTVFERNLMIGSRGEDVRRLQMLLNKIGFSVSVSGPGSKGQETNYFGPLTQIAVINYQKANKINPAFGYFGPITRESIKMLGITNE